MILSIEIIFIISITAILYHLFLYPILLRWFSSQRRPPKPGKREPLHEFVIIIPMHNEATFIEQKIDNLAALNYPFTHFKVLFINDGSTDNTFQITQKALMKYPNLQATIKSYKINQGKVACLNSIIPTIADNCILFFSDVSALLSKNSLLSANKYFNNPKIGAYSSKYTLNAHSLNGEKSYWAYQSNIQCMEGRLGSPLGYHGAGYAIRKKLWEPLPVDTMNDDFVIPMKIIAKGYLGVYDERNETQELELSSTRLDWNRRVRIARGNIQQVFLLSNLLSFKQGYIAWMFLSCKVLRIFLPWFFLTLFISSFILSFSNPLWYLPILSIQILVYVLVLVHKIYNPHIKIIDVLSYFVTGLMASLTGWFVFSKVNHRWQRAKSSPKSSYIHPVVRALKWTLDKTSALVGLAIFLVFFPFLALLIKWNSPGPIFYKQLRVGKSTDKETRLFYIYKLRTMTLDADKSKSKWTMQEDVRIYPFGHFLRRTHLDELPQFYNILKGDMSLIGPRPERPSLYLFIEKNIPFYTERLYGIRPGLTGLAQVTLGPDRVIEDVRKKVSFDHAYAIHLTRPWLWIKLELLIILKTLKAVVLGKEI